MRRAAIGLALLAAGCATAPQPETSYGFWDSNALDALVAAAHTCGLQDVEMSYSSFQDRHMVPSVYIPVRKADPTFRCTMAWIKSHPETGLRVPR